MRRVYSVSILVALLALPSVADAQQQVRRVRIAESRGVHIGFSGNSLGDGFKAGLWAPVLVRFVDDPEGKIHLPLAPDGSVSGEVFIETADNDGVATVYRQKFTIGPSDPLEVLSYTKIGGSHSEINVRIRASTKTSMPRQHYGQGLDLGNHLYLALGDSLAELNECLIKMAQPKDKRKDEETNRDSRPRFAFYENNPQHLPDRWFGYNAVDLAILVTSNEKFLEKLLGDRQPTSQLQALAEWVRRGGRLAVSISPTNRDVAHRLLTSAAWQPALPQVLSLNSKVSPLGELHELRNWCNTGGFGGDRFKLNRDEKQSELLGVRLNELPTVGVGCRAGEGKEAFPIIVRFPHGMGNITLVAFDVKDAVLGSGKEVFWQAVIKKLAPVNAVDARAGFDQNFPIGNYGTDLTSKLYDELEKFDTPIISFGWVALFIFIYILVVGPLDYFILKLLFKRLELTWLTFPAVVLSVSLIAYFTAYAIKGQDLKVNKIDLVDIDLRTALGDDLQPTSAKAYGTTWFSLRSPRIQSYTIGIEPALQHWQPGSAASSKSVEPTVSWLGRPEFGGLGSTGRGRSSGLFSRSYEYETDAVGLRGVAIPVWSTRSFIGSWEAPFDKSKLPLEPKLTYEPGKSDLPTGTLRSNLAFDLTEVGLIYRGQLYPLADIPKGSLLTLKLDPLHKDLTAWAAPNQPDRKPLTDPDSGLHLFDPSLMLRSIMFHEKVDATLAFRNHVHRPIDWSWRFDRQWGLNPTDSEGIVKEMILVARVGRVEGNLEDVHVANDPKLATHLWLGELPGPSPRPKLEGMMIQETYLRAILPVIPRK